MLLIYALLTLELVVSEPAQIWSAIAVLAMAWALAVALIDWMLVASDRGYPA